MALSFNCFCSHLTEILLCGGENPWWRLWRQALPPGTSLNRLSAASRILKSSWRTAACESFWSQTAAEKSRVGPEFQKWQKWTGDGWCLGEPLYTFLVIPGSKFWPTQEHKEPKKYRKTWTAELKMVEVRTLTILTLMRRGRSGGEIDNFR
jgi:hypothetical protein